MRPLSPIPGRAALLVAVVASIAACGPAEQPNGAEPAGKANATAVAKAPAAPVAPASMDRRAFIEAAWRAAAAAAAGSDDSAAQRGLDGRRIEVRLRFGCAGPEQELKSAALGWSFDQTDRTLRVRAAPNLTGASPEITELLGVKTEAVEGFWLQRPWLLEPVCPRVAALAPKPESEGETAREDGPQAPAAVQSSGKVGIAEFFSPTDARTGRRDSRAYEIVKELAADQPISSQGFNLVLSGRLRALPGKKVINCIVASPNSPPNCVGSADLDRVWIEHPATGETIAEWSRN